MLIIEDAMHVCGQGIYGESLCYACIGAGNIWGLSVPSPQFCCKPKTLKKKSLYKRLWGINVASTLGFEP